ncbi:hypothetical protein [Bradyrhizobium sp.]|uniref:hypothetical protein n=1 Tax=Bradyrhizobium sp. TaxID=376 RepID=UPI00391C8447
MRSTGVVNVFGRTVAAVVSTVSAGKEGVGNAGDSAVVVTSTVSAAGGTLGCSAGSTAVAGVSVTVAGGVCGCGGSGSTRSTARTGAGSAGGRNVVKPDA